MPSTYVIPMWVSAVAAAAVAVGVDEVGAVVAAAAVAAVVDDRQCHRCLSSTVGPRVVTSSSRITLLSTYLASFHQSQQLLHRT